MTLTPSDMLAIQSAIDAYENRFPHRPSPSAEEALASRGGNSWDRLLLWWHVVVMPRIKPVSFLNGRRSGRGFLKDPGPGGLSPSDIQTVPRH
jgi:hypothetical protein